MYIVLNPASGVLADAREYQNSTLMGSLVSCCFNRTDHEALRASQGLITGTLVLTLSKTLTPKFITREYPQSFNRYFYG